ncbi:MAG: TatD family hydrolase [Bacteroidales bacterium]|nr:TatD family hydrolase [Bacteroidales bacterium]
MIDTHTHLYLTDYSEEDPEGCAKAVDRAVEAGVGLMILPAVDRESCPLIADLHSRRPDTTFTAMGIHPTEVEEDWREELAEIVAALRPTRPVAIGEVGIDRHYGDGNLPLQKEAFIAQLLLAAEEKLPVIIHCRDAVEECCDCIVEARRLNGDRPFPTLVFHSFTGTPADVRRIREVCDPYFGINGVVTFKNSGEVPQAVEEIGIGRIVLETDAPWLAPVPKRGRRNESAYIPFINDKIAEVLSLPADEVAATTTRNAKEIFGI